MRRHLRYLVVGLMAVSGPPALLHAQSLADVAKAEEARRKTVKRPAKVYTNDDLKPSTDPVPVPGSAPAAATSNSSEATPPPASSTTEPKKDEKYWKDRITGPREALAHAQVLADAVQSRINALTTDFANTSDPVQRGIVQTNRNTALAELDRLNIEVKTQTKAVSDIQEEARKAGVPPGWLR